MVGHNWHDVHCLTPIQESEQSAMCGHKTAQVVWTQLTGDLLAVHERA